MRTFTRQEATGMGLPDNLASSPEAARPGQAVLLEVDDIEQHRSAMERSLVFRAPDDGRTYQVYFLEDLTGYGGGDVDPWFDRPYVEAEEVEPHLELVASWRSVGSHTAPAVPVAAVGAALRKWLAVFDYGHHKATECHEVTGEDTYPQGAEVFSRELERALMHHLLP